MKTCIPRPLLIYCYTLLLLIGVMTFTGCKKESPIHAQDALSTFELEEGFKIELIAAEPLIGDPVDMEIDEYGRLLCGGNARIPAG